MAHSHPENNQCHDERVFVRIVICEDAILVGGLCDYLKREGIAYISRQADSISRKASEVAVELFVLPVELTALTVAMNWGLCNGVRSELHFGAIPTVILNRSMQPNTPVLSHLDWLPFLRLLPH